MSYYKVGSKVNFKREMIINELIKGMFIASLVAGFIVCLLIPS